MDAFGDDSNFNAASDPAADFLAREQAELGEDLGQELGLDSNAVESTSPAVVLDEVVKARNNLIFYKQDIK